MGGIIIDAVLILILMLSVFLGYKKGLVKLGARLIAGIAAIILALVLYRPISEVVINNTSLDENIEKIIMENTNKFIENKKDNSNSVSSNITESIQNNIVPEQSKQLAKGIVYAIIGIALYISVKIVLSIIVSLLDLVAKLPILKQFNEIGGIIYGTIRGALIVCILVLLMGVIIKMNPENILNEKLGETYLTKLLYENIVKF